MYPEVTSGKGMMAAMQSVTKWSTAKANGQRAQPMNPIKNLQINLLAKGGWAIAAVVIICITALGLFGEGQMAERAMTVLTIMAGSIIAAMAVWPRD